MNLLQKLIHKWKTSRIKLVNDPSWETIHQATDEFEIRIMKLKLEDEGIPVSIFDQRDSSYNAFGYIYLSVPTEYIEKAKSLLNIEDE